MVNCCVIVIEDLSYKENNITLLHDEIDYEVNSAHRAIGIDILYKELS